MTRPFKVLGIQQIAIGGLDKQRLGRLWIDMLGLQLAGNFRSERENVDEDIAALGTAQISQISSIRGRFPTPTSMAFFMWLRHVF